MSGSNDDYDEIKRKIRKLKKLEVKIRFANNSFAKSAGLVWDEFLATGEAKYSIVGLASMNKEEFKNVVNEFFFNIYYRFYKENGIVNTHLYDPDILVQMGLSFDADVNAIKKKFRELAKKYHPDTGGDSTKFIELMENYKKLVN